MARKAEVPEVETIVVDVARFGHDAVSVRVPVDSTVGAVLDESGIDIPRNASLFVNGEEVSRDDIAEDDDLISVTTPKGAGAAGLLG